MSVFFRISFMVWLTFKEKYVQGCSAPFFKISSIMFSFPYLFPSIHSSSAKVNCSFICFSDLHVLFKSACILTEAYLSSVYLLNLLKLFHYCFSLPHSFYMKVPVPMHHNYSVKQQLSVLLNTEYKFILPVEVVT